jgi:hypothetical protein
VSGERLIRVNRTTAFLPEDGALRRLPRAPHKQRSPMFHERFEDRALVYDCFRHGDGERILLVGPPPMNLRPLYRKAHYEALPSRAPLAPRYHASLSTIITELGGAPEGTTVVRMVLGGETFELPIGSSQTRAFVGRRVLFTMSKDNELGWIAEWARWHARLHGVDSVVLFDNGSSRYQVGEIEETLLGIPGLAVVCVPSWPGRFGMTDQAQLINPYWSHFLQISSMSVALRRFGASAFGLLNCDIDELAATRSGKPIFDYLESARHGLVVFRGQWIEAANMGESHSDHVMRRRDPRAARSGPKKWLLDPKKDWVKSLDVHPYWHWVHGRPAFGKTVPADAFYRHFKAINTNWKEARTEAADPVLLETDVALVADFGRMAGDG